MKSSGKTYFIMLCFYYSIKWGGKMQKQDFKYHYGSEAEQYFFPYLRSLYHGQAV